MAEYNYRNPSNKMRAKKLLDSLLPVAREKKSFFEDKDLTSSASTLFQNVAIYLSEEKFAGAHVYPAPLGGWHGDIVLKDMPAGVPTVLGTPKAMPCSSRQEAIDAVTTTLAMLLWNIDQASNQTPDPKVAVFHYDDLSIEVPQIILEKLSTLEHPGVEYAESRLDEIREELFEGKRLNSNVFESLNEEARYRIVSVFSLGLLAGIFRWPPTKDGLPESYAKHLRH